MSVAGKIVQVMKAVTSLSKDGHMQAQNYNYLSEEKVTTELHGACADAGLTISPIAMEIIGEREDTTANGKILHLTRILVTYRLADSESDDEKLIQALGEGSDSGDKCLNKCMTAAYKYALRQTFMISTGDDPDHAASEEATQTQQKPTPRRSTGGSQQQSNEGGADDHYSYLCEDCHQTVTGHVIQTGAHKGKWFSAHGKEEKSIKEFNARVCFACGNKRRESAPVQ